VGRYLDGLLAQWASSGATSRHQFTLYTPSALPARYSTSSTFSTFEVRVLPGTAGTWWQQTTLAAAIRRDLPDVFFAPQYTSPLLVKTPTVVVIYDVSFAAHPEWFRTREGIRLRTLTRWSARRAREVVTISEFSRREIAEHLGVGLQRIHVIPPGIPTRTPSIAPKDEARLLYVGSIFNRRHVIDLIRAFATVAREHGDASLDLVGDNRTFPVEDITSAIARERLGDRIRWHRYASDDLLADLYSRSRAFAFFSDYEGLGLTPLEALAAGAPPVLYDTSIARESCGGAALYVAPGDSAAATRALEALLYDDGTRAGLLEVRASVLARYSWPRAAAETLNVIEGCR
ncbi:MAG TPA: glycosyltransferase family 1 protein, partial [Vicinamibacterales bacterium]|nr:glycosyltransferase family 1 protein [Vicinamibacterales bacterium]